MLFAVLVEGLNIAVRTSRAAGARAADSAAGDVLSELLVRAQRMGASAVQLVADDAGAVWCWMAVGKTLQEDNACSGLGWKSLRSALDARLKAPEPALVDGARQAVSISFAPVSYTHLTLPTTPYV